MIAHADDWRTVFLSMMPLRHSRAFRVLLAGRMIVRARNAY
jgi:hypothetical protein